MLVTTMVQSSSAVTVAAIGFVNAGLLGYLAGSLSPSGPPMSSPNWA